jgi:hypothetical protein
MECKLDSLLKEMDVTWGDNARLHNELLEAHHALYEENTFYGP